MWHDGDQPLKEQSALYSWCRVIRTDPSWMPFCSPQPHQFLSQWLANPLGTSHKRGMWLPPGVSECPGKSLHHSKWRGILDVWSTWFQPAPLLPKWYNFPQSIFSRGAKNALYKRHLSSSSFPLGLFTELKPGGWQAFPGSCPIHAFSDILIWL